MPAPDNKANPHFRNDLSRQLRSSSPAVKRPASDMGAQDREEHTTDVDMDRSSSPAFGADTGSSQLAITETTPKAKQIDTGLRHQREVSVDMFAHESNPKAATQTISSDDTLSTMSDPILPASSSASTPATSIRPDPSSSSLLSRPSIDEQVVRVSELINKEIHHEQKGYVVSAKWLSRVQSRSSIRTEGQKIDKSALEGEIGPVDNSDLVLAIEGSGSLDDEAGKKFIPLRPGLQIGEDFQVLPQEAWDLVVQWYGNGAESPIITRYAYQTGESLTSNCQYELNPPIMSLLKVVAGSNARSQREKDLPPLRILVSRHTAFMQWIEEAKALLNIDEEVNVRVWRVLGGLRSTTASGIITPAASRSASPAPGADIVATAGDRMVLDVNTFLALRQGEERELLDVKDPAIGETYDLSTTFGQAGINGDAVLVLEEQTRNKASELKWASEIPATHLGIGKTTAGFKKSAITTSGTGPVTRGRHPKPQGITGLNNMGNTCYMNSALQCIRSVEELTQYFLHDNYKKDLNPSNPLSHNGEVAKAYAALLKAIYTENPSSFTPTKFKNVVGRYGPSFAGYGQQDSQEFLLFLLDGLQEDLNRIHKKPYIEKPDSTDEMVTDAAALRKFADKNWQIYKARNDSVITDLFAGMYKSTVTCPVCDKVSIIFDPFNNLTLQLPIENNWSREILYFPLYRAPIRVLVDIDKNATFSGLKEFVAKRVKSDPARLIVAEAYKNRFYKVFDNITSISEASIQPGDVICVYELDSVPTNFKPNKPKRFGGSLFTRGSSEEPVPAVDSPEAERLLVPVYNRCPAEPPRTSYGRAHSKAWFGEPSFVVISRDDSKSYDRILQKVLGSVAGMTTMKIFAGDLLDSVVNTPEDSDVNLMNEDDQSTDSNKVQAMSVEGEDLVNVSMKDAGHVNGAIATEQTPEIPEVLRPGNYVPAQLQTLFDMQYFNTKEAVPIGWNNLDDNKEKYESISDRMPKVFSQRSGRKGKRNVRATSRTGSTSSSGSANTMPHDASPSSPDQSEVESSDYIGVERDSGPDEGLSDVQEMFSLPTKQPKPYSRSGRKKFGKHRAEERPYDGPLIRPGEIIVLDWGQATYETLFKGDKDEEDSIRGQSTWDQAPLLEDQELATKRERRSLRRKNGITLADCLNEFGKSETLSENNAWYCPRCKEHRRADKKFELWKAPDILVMHLKRFSSNRNFRDKLDVTVDYPIQGLDLSDRVIMNEEGKSLVYDLIAVDNHYGGLGGGHYTAYAQNFLNNLWYEYNDAHVSQKNNPQVVVTNAAYLLFYRRRSDHPLGGAILEKITESANAASADSAAAVTSRDPSPSSGEGRRLVESSHNGSSSASGLGQAHRVGDGGLATITTRRKAKTALAREVSPEDESRQTLSDRMDDLPPAYDEDEGIDTRPGLGGGFIGPLQPWNASQGWSFNSLNTAGGRTGPSQLSTLAPSNSMEYLHEEPELSDGEGDAASTRADGGARSSPNDLSDTDERMKDLSEDEDHGVNMGNREEARVPITMQDEDEDDMEVIELKLPDEAE